MEDKGVKGRTNKIDKQTSVLNSYEGKETQMIINEEGKTNGWKSNKGLSWYLLHFYPTSITV